MNIEHENNILDDPMIFGFARLLNELRLFNETMKPLNDYIERELLKNQLVNTVIIRRGVEIPVSVEYFKNPLTNKFQLGYAQSPLGYEVLTEEEEREILKELEK